MEDETAECLRDATQATRETFAEQMRTVPTIGTDAAQERMQAVHDALDDLERLAEGSE